MLYLNLNAWCAQFQGDCKEELLAELMVAGPTPKAIQAAVSSRRIQMVGWMIYLHLDETRGRWMLPASLN